MKTRNTNAAIQKLVQYNWDDEERSYWESDAEGRPNHIFKVLRILNKKYNCGTKENPDYRGWDPREEEV